jgi:predicted XRE-type DNA-binding protein
VPKLPKGSRAVGSVQNRARPKRTPVLPRSPLAREVQRLIRARGLSQTAAARLVQDAPSQLSLLMRDHLESFSAERLIRMLLELGRDVEVTIRPSSRSRRSGRVLLKVERDA